MNSTQAAVEAAATETTTVCEPEAVETSYELTSTMFSSSTDDHCPLLSLPPEIRNRIYEYAVVEEPYVDVAPHFRRGCQQPSLTRTCRQLRNESLGLFYELNTFRIKRTYGQDLGPIQINLNKIKRFQIKILDHSAFVALDVGKSVADCKFHLVHDIDRKECTCLRYNSAAVERTLQRTEEFVVNYRSGKTSLDKLVRNLMDSFLLC